MLTAFQCEVIAYSTEGGIVCSDCATKVFETEGGDGVQGFQPLIRYSVDEYQGEQYAGEDLDVIWGEDADEHTDECAPGVACDDCLEDIVEAYHYHPEVDPS